MQDIESTLQVGHSVGERYRVLQVLGRGAHGAVYLVQDDRDSHKRFVLKHVRDAARHNRRESFSFDAAALKRLSHPALPDIYKVFSDDKLDGFAILMDYVEGSNLEEVRQLMPGKRFSLHTALTLLSPIMDATSYLHRQQPHLVHGDIKPANILASLAGSATPTRLVDFGGAESAGSADAPAGQSTRNYRAPEQFGRRASRRTDVYGLGATFYTLLTGVVPVAAPERLACIERGGPDPLVPANAVNPFVHSMVAEAISRAMALSRNDRYASVERFREALWQVMHAHDLGAQIPDGALLVAAEERMRAETGPDSAMLEADSPALIAYALLQEEVTFVGVHSGPLRASRFPEHEEHSSEERTSEGRTGVVGRQRRRVPADGGAHGFYGGRRRTTRPLLLAGLLLLVLCMCGSGVALAGYQMYSAKYQNQVAAAQGGMQHLQRAVSLMRAWSNTPLDAATLTRARGEFAAAAAVFTQLDTEVEAYARYATAIPGLGPRLNAALHVVPIATAVSQAGVAGCEALAVMVSRVREPFGTGSGITLADLSEIGKDLQRAQVAIRTAMLQAKALRPADVQFDARLGKAVALFQQSLPTVQAVLSEADQLLPILPALLGITAPAYYLVEILDSTQLRPGGGFIKDYGFATFVGGRLSATHISDTNLLDSHFSANGQPIPYPAAYKWFDLASSADGWNLRDSNLDADFPTAASYAERNYTLEGGRAPLQGVIAITTTLMERALAITGPIYLPELHETVSAHNLLDRIHYYQIGPGSQVSSVLRPGETARGSRYFTEVLAQAFLARMHHLGAADVPPLMHMLVSSLRTKDLQIYFNAAPAEGLLKLAAIDAAIQVPAGDSLFVVDTNIADNTANQFITNTLSDQVSIAANGDVTHHSVLRYAWARRGAVLGTVLYSDYVRVYVPPGSSLQQQQGWQPAGTSQAFGRQVWAGSFTLSYGQATTISLIWTEKGVARKDAAGWHYQYLLQRQAGATWMVHLQISLPACAAQLRPSAGLLARSSREASLNTSLTEDTPVGIEYRC
jgi:Protein kinase domain/Protein of unknown function (DUF4012)